MRVFFSFLVPIFASLALVLVALSSCGSDDDNRLCPALSGNTDGIFLKNCARGTVRLSGVTYKNGAMTSYAFVVVCPDRAAHGLWSETGGLDCVEGASPCQGDVCAPMSNADCAVLTNCIDFGECGYADGKCVLTDAGCSHSRIPCGLSGACHLGTSGVCATTSDDDCRAPFPGCPDCFKGACLTSGNCYAENGACLARQDGDCKKAEQCAFAGKCTLEASACVAASDSDCRGSEVCRTAGQCAAIGGGCQAL